MALSKRNTILVFLCSTLSALTFAAGNEKITIINHFNKPLLITKHLNGEALPGLPEQFTLLQNSETSSEMVEIQKRTYVRVEDGNAHSAYWGIKAENGQFNIHGYVSKGIAYSWDTHKIVFCTPEEYKQHKGCLN